MVQSAATSSEVRFSRAALDEYRGLLERYPTRSRVQLNHQRYYENLAEDSTARLIDELAGRAD
jgi:hypothetical protein